MLVARLILPGAAAVLAGVLAGVLAPGLARAGDGVDPRVPVLWEPEPACMTVVDRTVDTKLVFGYTIPYEDTTLTPHEVVDSRRHQFLGFCRGHSRQEPLPVWLTEVDLAAAAAKMLIDPASVKAEDVFETSVEWKDCWFRITGDDERRPINFEEAMKPVVWDTAMLPAGPYVVAGYTWQPAFNTWAERSGVIRVIDDPDPAANPPALALTNGEEIKFGNEVMTLTGCLGAMDGSTITGYWALTEPDTLEWQVFASDVPVSGDSFELEFVPPPESHGAQIAMKVEIVDPMDRRFTAHLDSLATILPPVADTGGCEDSGSSFIGDPGCSDSGASDSATSDATSDATSGPDGSSGGSGAEGSGGTSSGAGSDTTGPGAQPGGEGGCGCRQTGESAGGSGGASALLVGLGLWVGRRRRARRTATAG